MRLPGLAKTPARNSAAYEIPYNVGCAKAPAATAARAAAASAPRAEIRIAKLRGGGGGRPELPPAFCSGGSLAPRTRVGGVAPSLGQPAPPPPPQGISLARAGGGGGARGEMRRSAVP